MQDWNRHPPTGADIEEQDERLAALSRSFRGSQRRSFLCPILLVEEQTLLCKGHVIPKGAGGGSRVIQRRDVDSFFGTFAQADFVRGIELRGLGSFEDRVNYLTRHKPAASRFQFHLVGSDDVEYDNARVFRIDNQRIGIKSRHNIPDRNVQLGYSYDLRCATLLTCLHSMHLGNFRRMGYRYAGTFGAAYTANLLADMFNSYNGKPRIEVSESEVAEKCSSLKNAVRPATADLDALDPRLVRDPFNWFLVAWYRSPRFGGRPLPFARIHFLRVGDGIVYGVVSFNLDHGTTLPVMAFCAAKTNVSVEFSLGHCSKDRQAVEVGPPRGQRLVWPCGDESSDQPPVTIERVARVFLETVRSAKA